ncbi:amidase [Pseudomonas fluorescens]|uniref:amidase n=1 Tax=Pseudomonas fluorescens TaxID=294 RepID=UPI001BE78613|nr:amidase [Pseudomonas fluorescens]MBT2375652.1 amidase [Pseudomonas fluorescens]
MNHLDATAIAEAVRSGATTAAVVAEHFLGQIERHEPVIQAFASFDPQAVRQQLRSTDGPLAGVPVGIKDIFDTADHPTEFYSPIYQGNRPSRDAHVVALLRLAGAVIIGKTHTTEFAYMHTGPTRNPRDLSRTPGSSSAGSAAGMAAGFFPLALGTQTAGSLLKPAAYCGLYAFKPSLGLVSLEGVKPLAPSFDTVGWYGRSVRDLERLARVLIPGFPPVEPVERPLNLGFYRTDRWQDVDPVVAKAIEQAINLLASKGHQISEVTLPEAFAGVFDDHQLINDCEGARSLAKEFQAHPELLSDSTLAMFERAKVTTWEQESAAKARLTKLAPLLTQICRPFDGVLSVSCGMLAPTGLASTGPSDFIKFWGAFGWPQMNIPLWSGEGELPVGLQVVGAFRDDAQLLRVAHAISQGLHREAGSSKKRGV